MLKFLVIFIFLCELVFCPPVPNPKKSDDIDNELDKLLSSIDYGTYLSQVMQELQSDETFNKNIDNAHNSTSISDALKFVSTSVRSKLDELKRLEIMRLNKLQKEMDRRKKSDYHPHEIPVPPVSAVDISHLDDNNPESFNQEDLKRLIDRTTEIVNRIDSRNEEEYKQHEMEKKAKMRAEMESKITDAKLREQVQSEWAENEKKKHSNRKMIHEPASIEQLKNVWKVDDHMDEDSFNPRTFFYMHDVNGDGNLDVAELETLMQRELDKAYDLNDNATDLIERYHEMTRMRKKFLKHVDTDNNHLVSLDEFLAWLKSDEANQDRGWKIQEEMDPNYSNDEFDKFYNDYLTRHPELNQPPIPLPATPISISTTPTATDTKN